MQPLTALPLLAPQLTPHRLHHPTDCKRGVTPHETDYAVSYMSVDHSIRCDAYLWSKGERGGYYYYIVIYSWLMIVVYVVGIPLLYAVLLFKERKVLTQPNLRPR